MDRKLLKGQRSRGRKPKMKMVAEVKREGENCRKITEELTSVMGNR